MNNRIIEKCKELGMKMTGQRQTIAEVITDAKDHPNVEEVFKRAQALDAKVSIATVYRTIRSLEEAGIIEKHDFGEGFARYEEATDDHHDHIINMKTGEVMEFSDEALEAIQEEIAKKFNLRIVGHRLDIYCMPKDE